MTDAAKSELLPEVAMPRGIGVLLGAMVALSAPLAAQQLSTYWVQCVNDGRAFSNDAIIGGCTGVLQSGQESVTNRAIAYYNRGVAHRAKRETERAIADYTEAIKLNPSYVNAYFNRGVAYRATREIERAIADYNEVIKLNRSDAGAYNNRGLAYQDQGELDRAIADHSEAIRLFPRYADAYNDRGLAHQGKGQIERAIADYNEAIRLSPKYEWAYANRGRAFLYNGSPERALADLKQARDLSPKDAYAVLWLDLAERRNKAPSRLKDFAAKLDMGAWPGPVVRHYLGELGVEQTFAAAEHADPRTRSDQVCEVNFFAGVLMALEGRKDDAVRMLRLAAAGCPRDFTEWGAARAELRLLGVEQP
jgi:lipoprotein NlpI